MKQKLESLFGYIKALGEADLDRLIRFVFSLVSLTPTDDRPACPHCGSQHVTKNGHVRGKQRFVCHECSRSFSHTTNTLMAQSHYQASVWADFIRDTLDGESLDSSAEKFLFSHQTAFNMRHKVLMALQDLGGQQLTILSGTAECDETFVLDCYKGAAVPEQACREARKHGAKASKRGISNEYVAICTGIQRDGGVIAETVNRAKPSGEELELVFRNRIAWDTLVLTDGLRSYSALEPLTSCTVVDINHEEGRGIFNLNTVNSLHSYIKETYNHYRGVATKYLNRYNALFAAAFRCSKQFGGTLFSALCTIGKTCHWHGVKEIRSYQLVIL